MAYIQIKDRIKEAWRIAGEKPLTEADFAVAERFVTRGAKKPRTSLLSDEDFLLIVRLIRPEVEDIQRRHAWIRQHYGQSQ
jgi:hypothetical protein